MGLTVPPFMTDPEMTGPCPCGQPPNDEVIIVKGKTSQRWFHEPCMSLLKYELSEDEMRDIEEWRKHRREAQDPEV